MARTHFVTFLAYFLAIHCTLGKGDDAKNILDQIKDTFQQNINNFNQGVGNFTNPIIDRFKEGGEKIKEVTDNIGKFIEIGGKKIICSLGICMTEMIRKVCEEINSCPEGYRLVESYCGCCNKCVYIDDENTSSQLFSPTHAPTSELEFVEPPRPKPAPKPDPMWTPTSTPDEDDCEY